MLSKRGERVRENELQRVDIHDRYKINFLQYREK